MPEEITPQPYDPDRDGNYKARRPVTLLAAFGLIAVTVGAVGGLVYDLAINGGTASLTQLGTLATLGVGGLLALAGNRQSDK